MSGRDAARVLVFAKAPEPGSVKTRLIPALGAGGAAVLAARMIRRSLAIAVSAGIGPVELWCAPDTAHSLFALCQRDFGVSLHRQVGNDLGQRMSHAFTDALKRGDHAILIGTDIPTLHEDDLAQAHATLRAGVDAVIGPTVDGGYYLLGLRTIAAEVFAGVTWSTGKVMAETQARIRTLNWSLRELAARWDVDVPEDLARLKSEPIGAELLAKLSLMQPIDFTRASNDTRAS